MNLIHPIEIHRAAPLVRWESVRVALSLKDFCRSRGSDLQSLLIIADAFSSHWICWSTLCNKGSFFLQVSQRKLDGMPSPRIPRPLSQLTSLTSRPRQWQLPRRRAVDLIQLFHAAPYGEYEEIWYQPIQTPHVAWCAMMRPAYDPTRIQPAWFFDVFGNCLVRLSYLPAGF